MIGNIPVAPIAFGVDLDGAPSPLNLLATLALPAACFVKEPGVIMGCGGSLGARDRAYGALFKRDLIAGVIRCRFCDADVTATMPAEAWADAFMPAMPAAPGANARAAELRATAVRGFADLRALVAEDRGSKARERLYYGTVWAALDAIAAGCADPAGLARELDALRAEVNASRG